MWTLTSDQITYAGNYIYLYIVYMYKCASDTIWTKKKVEL